MNLSSKSRTKALLNKYQTPLLKRLAQNFLVDKIMIKRVIKAADLKNTENVLEIGPGVGILTQELAKKVKKVLAVEKDPRMVEILRETLKDFKNIKVVQKDVLKIENCELIENWKLEIGNYKVVANLPFYITAPVIRKFLEVKNPPKEMILIVQKEVAQRICARSPKMNLLAVSVQFYSVPKIISYISKNSFYPKPKVNAAILKITPLLKNRDTIPVSAFFRVVKAGFLHPRKQLINNLSKGLAKNLPKGVKLDKELIKTWLKKNNIKPEQRAESLNIKDWLNLTKTIKF